MPAKFLRPGWIFGHLIVLLAVLVCLRLGWWQWDRTNEASGTIQNLGYALLWPIFGAAFIYMWVRFLQLEVLKDEEEDAALTELAAGEPLVPEDDHPPVMIIDSEDPARDGFEKPPQAQTDLTSVDLTSTPVGLDPFDKPADDARPGTALAERPDASVARSSRLAARRTPSTSVTVGVGMVGLDDEDEDPELAAYNRALAALAERDHRRAR